MSETVNERVISVIEMPGSVIEPEETALNIQTSELKIAAETTLVTNDLEYEAAAEFGKTIKAKANDVMNFFAPMKDAAHKAHKEICNREKTMLEPLNNAERRIKKAMGDYAMEQERKRKEAEAALRRAAEEEANRKLAEAVALEKQGKASEAADLMDEAEIIETATSTISVQTSAPKVSGVSTIKAWEIVSIDESKVPISISGAELRPVDKGAVMKLIKATKGGIKIPGIAYKEVAQISLRGR